MGQLDEMLETQNNEAVVEKQDNTQTTLLKKVSIVFKWFSILFFIIGFAGIIAGIGDNKEEPINIGIAVFIGGLFTLLYGCIGEAIDDIRESLKK